MFSPKSVMSPASDRKGGAMDRSYTSASARAVAASAARRRSSNIFANGRPSIGTGRSTPNRSLQIPQVTESGGNYNIESFGTCLPALVMEALAFADRNSEFSAVLAPSGWAWLVAGRRLLIWRYRTETSWRAANHQFRDLTLPPSDLAHRAQLVTVFSQTEGQTPSCVAVSPEGFVRYWPNVTHEGSYHEVSTELQGQECDSVLFMGPSLGCLLATTTSTLLLVQTGVGMTGSSNINVRQLKVPAGILGGISRRVSSLMFGSMPTQVPEARLVGVLAVENVDLDERNIVVVSARSLQKWYLAQGEPDRLLYECNIDKFIYDAFIDHVWGREKTGNHQLQTWLIAAQTINNGKTLMILTAAVNSLVSQQLVYAFVSFDVSGTSPPCTILRFAMLKHSEYYQESAESQMLAQRFVLCGNAAYIYTKNSVLCVAAANSGESDVVDRIEFSTAGDSILGAGRCSQSPLFFTSNNGVVSITPSSNNLNNTSVMMSDTLLDETVDVTSNLSCFVDPGENTVNDASVRLQTAFLHFNKKNLTQANLIIEELFPGGESDGVDGAVTQLSLKIIDDKPSSDPRWAEVCADETPSTKATSSTKSLLITNQINDKIRAHRLYILFLQKMNIWQRLGVTTLAERTIHTRILLAEHAEHLAFAAELLCKHSDHQALVNAAIRAVLDERSVEPTGRLTNADVFYRAISQVGQIIWGLIRAQEEVLSADISPRDASLTIYNVNSIILSLLKDAREAKYMNGRGTRALMTESQIEYIPWTSSVGPRGMRSLLPEQHDITVDIGLTRAEDGIVRGKLYNQIVEMVDEMLAGFQPHLSSLAPIHQSKHQVLTEEYQRVRYAKIQPLVKGEQYDQATNLAEKYCDFRTLIEICDKTDNQTRLNHYMTKFNSQGFSDFVFRWYLETGKRGKLISHGREGSNAKQDLTKFLQEYSSLAWLHQINSRDFSAAHKTLKDLAYDEKSYLSRKKTLLALAKLSGIAANDLETEAFRDPNIITEEDLVELQENLPKPILDAHAISAETMRVFTPIELIHMYCGQENARANEFDFKKALEILSYVDDADENNNMKRLIWATAIQRDAWVDLDTDNPVEALSNTIFYRTVDLAYIQGCYLPDVMLPVEEILSLEELQDLKDDAKFQFLIKAAYEELMERHNISQFY